MPRSSSVSEKIWAQAIHAVTVQKMSLRRAAQLYGVHHMSLHRRVRGRYVSTSTARFADEFQLSRAEEDEVISVLREQYIHEHLVTSDDVRYVVRTIACQNGRRDIPSDFPQNRWIAAFKRTYGFANVSPRELLARDSSTSNGNGSYEDAATNSPLYSNNSGSSPGSGPDHVAAFNPPPPAQSVHRGSQVASPMYTTASASAASAPSSSRANNMFESQRTLSRAYPSQSMVAMQASALHGNGNGNGTTNDERDDTSESDSEHNRESTEQDERFVEEKRCRQSNTVSAETWEKAMDAVEIHGMSLRNAAKAYGVHFAALHRRVKKRALKKESAPPLENYIPFEDEAGIVRVIHARADLGIIMTYEELVELLNRTALKYSPVITVEVSRALVRRFQSRVEQSIRHLICDWPLPRLDSLCHFRAPATPTSNALGAVATAAAMEEEKIMPSPQQHMHMQMQQHTMPSIYMRNPDHFGLSDAHHRMGFSEPFMRPVYQHDDASKAMVSPADRLVSAQSSVLRL